ncbi:MAG: hypothetical protein WCZ23_00400 [Rhodospirillaceae bacterium]
MKSLIKRISGAVAAPRQTLRHYVTRRDPRVFFQRHEALAVAAGLADIYLVLSFDCDTEEDIAVAWDVHTRLMDMGVLPVYAVPGELLVRGIDTYGRIAETGAEFMNHGGRSHTFFNTVTGRDESCFFYDQQTREAVHEDIVTGDAILRRELNIAPQGFRTPHFGTFGHRKHLAFLYNEVKSLGYRYSSSTMPHVGDRRGPVHRPVPGLVEFPVTGRASAPMIILDSWSAFRAPDRTLTPEDYVCEGTALAEAMAGRRAGLLNLYADPCHIAHEPAFFKAVVAWCRIAKPTSYQRLLDTLR